MNLIDVMGLGTVALRGICRLNVRFGSEADINFVHVANRWDPSLRCFTQLPTFEAIRP